MPEWGRLTKGATDTTPMDASAAWGPHGPLLQCRMNQGDSSPAAIPRAAEDIQGDDRRISQHHRFVLDCKDKEPDVLFVGDSMVQLMQQYEVKVEGVSVVLGCSCITIHY